MVNELHAVVKELGGRQTLGRNLTTMGELKEAIREGFPPAVVEQLMSSSGLTLKELADALDLSPRSLQRRRRSGRLARFESDRLFRLARIVAFAHQALGRPCLGFGEQPRGGRTFDGHGRNLRIPARRELAHQLADSPVMLK